jgi:hypothetical protein
MQKEDQTTSTEKPKPSGPPPVPAIPSSEPITRKKPPPIPKIPEPESEYKSTGNKKNND